MATLVLRPGRERSLLRRHPWVFSGAVGSLSGSPSPGETIEVRASDGRWLARAAYSPASQIVGRAWTFREAETVDAGLLRLRVREALLRRLPLLAGDTLDALRLVYSENDGLPGLVVDRYRDVLVAQLLSAGAERWRDELLEALGAGWAEAFPGTPLRGIWERSEADVRQKEGLPPRAGSVRGEEPPQLLEVREGPCRFLVDVRTGHKTGFYLDQRENRRAVLEAAAGREVLNAFAYTGGFGIAALAGGATRVTNLDSSSEALALGDRNRALNALPESAWENRPGDAFRVLRALQQEGRGFDLVVLDPPKFAESASQVERASRGYKDINLQAFRLLRPGGILFSFSCSGHISPELFQKIVADAALDAGREGRILRRLGQGPDHPTALAFPEGGYLKGLVVGVG
jgi:23S rRNA (cytosine1962-C5)-methyltransferase